MKVTDTRSRWATLAAGAVLCAMAATSQHAFAGTTSCDELPSWQEVHDALKRVQAGEFGPNRGLGNDMWATVVSRDGTVCVVASTGTELGDQWPGSRVISAQKANTANAFSLGGTYPNVSGLGRALSTGNLYGLVLEGGSLFGLQFSNPVDTTAAYAGDGAHFGKADDPLVGHRVGGVNVFGGGLALYTPAGRLVGALGVSGDTSCTDHITAWKTRWLLDGDAIPGGVGDNGTTDNLILSENPAPNSFEHPFCGFGEEEVIPDLNTDFPVGPAPAQQ